MANVRVTFFFSFNNLNRLRVYKREKNENSFRFSSFWFSSYNKGKLFELSIDNQEVKKTHFGNAW